MELTRKDGAATLLTALAVLVFFAAHESWNVPLVGDSVRWAAAAILVLGMVTCALGERRSDAASRIMGAIGVAALAFAVLALVTGSLTWLSLLTAAFVLLWLASTVRHALPRKAVPA
jgi:hypothetical protein